MLMGLKPTPPTFGMIAHMLGYNSYPQNRYHFHDSSWEQTSIARTFALKHKLSATLTLIAAVALSTHTVTAQELGAPIRIQANGSPIDVTVGHAAPFMRDMNGDGIRDLLVGEYGDAPFDVSRLPAATRKKWGDDFAQGKLRIYRNTGSNANPVFGDFKYLQAGGEDASIPTT